jgi:polyisoprenoid-binding protein YceI
MNVPVDAKFKKFSAAIDYDAAKPDAAKARSKSNRQLRPGRSRIQQGSAKKEWFNAAQFPKATFVSSSIKPPAPAS